MAKYGEGDARWIVEERKDGTNVNNWHWYAINKIFLVAIIIVIVVVDVTPRDVLQTNSFKAKPEM